MILKNIENTLSKKTTPLVNTSVVCILRREYLHILFGLGGHLKATVDRSRHCRATNHEKLLCKSTCGSSEVPKAQKPDQAMLRDARR